MNMKQEIDEKIQVSSMVPIVLKEEWDKIAEREDRSLASIIRILLESNLEEWKKKSTIIA